MTGKKITEMMKDGFTLHSSLFGWFMLDPIDSRCINIHAGAAKSLVRRKEITIESREGNVQKWKIVQLSRGDKVEAVRKIGKGLAEKGEVMTIMEDRGNGWFLVKPDAEKGGFLAKGKEIKKQS